MLSPVSHARISLVNKVHVRYRSYWPVNVHVTWLSSEVKAYTRVQLHRDHCFMPYQCSAVLSVDQLLWVIFSDLMLETVVCFVPQSI